MRAHLRRALVSLSRLTVWIACVVGASAYGQSLKFAQQPSSELQALTKALSGEWLLRVKFEPTSSAPSGLVNTGEETWRPGPGGFTLLEEEHLHLPEGDLLPSDRRVEHIYQRPPRNGVPEPAVHMRPQGCAE